MQENILKSDKAFDFFYTMTNVLPEPMLLVRKDFSIHATNSSAHNFFDKYNLENSSLLEIIEESDKVFGAWLKRSFRCPAMQPGKWTFHTKKGKTKLFCEAGLLRINNDTQYVLMRIYKENIMSKLINLNRNVYELSLEITKRKKIERQLKKNQKKLKSMNQKLEKLARVDELTKVANRRAFDEFLNREWNNCRRRNSSIALALIDIDYFKLYNDTYGHICGDSCLEKVAKTITTQVKRSSDLVARYGGEEFAVVISGGDYQQTLHLLNAVLETIRKLMIPHESSLSEKIVTVSVGVCSTDRVKVNSTEKLIEYADKALYRAKRSGRNQLVMA